LPHRLKANSDMTKNLGRDFVYGYETSKSVARPRRTLFGLGIGAFIPPAAMIAALLVGRYVFGF
jgi:hypothetical protein